MSMIKNIAAAEAMRFKDEVTYLKGQVVSKTLAQNRSVSMTLFAFDEGEEISTHESKGDAFVLILDGKGRITIEDKIFDMKEGDAIVMPAKRPHSVSAPNGKFKMLLTVIFPAAEPVRIE